MTKSEFELKWMLMIVMPPWIDAETFNQALESATKKLENKPNNIRLENFTEGNAVQIMHIGAYENIPKLTEKLYQGYLPTHNLIPNGPLHEIYLNDPSRVSPEKLKTILRQPIV